MPYKSNVYTIQRSISQERTNPILQSGHSSNSPVRKSNYYLDSSNIYQLITNKSFSVTPSAMSPSLPFDHLNNNSKSLEATQNKSSLFLKRDRFVDKNPRHFLPKINRSERLSSP